MELFRKMDWWSIMDGLDELIEYDYKGNEKESIYWDYYSEQITELCVLASDMYNELDSIKRKMWYMGLPEKRIEFCDEDYAEQTVIAWWNTAACMMTDIDMETLLEHENIYRADEECEKEKRIKAMQRLTKEQYFKLQSLVLGFLIRYIELVGAFDVITSCIRELDYHQSAVKNKQDTTMPDAAYL